MRRCRSPLPPRAGPAVHRDGCAARRASARGGGRTRSSISKSASPARRRRRRCSMRRAARSPQDRIGYTDALGHRGVARRRSPRHYRDAIRRRGRPGRDRRHDRLVGRVSARLSRRVRARRPGRAGGARAIPPIATSCRRSVSKPVLIEVGENAHYQPNPELLADSRRPCRADRRQPGQPDRHDDRAGRTRAPRRLLPRARHPPRLRRDLSRHHL